MLENPFLIIGLVALGLPYAFTSLMLSFLHDRPWAAAPHGVLCALSRHGCSLLPVLLQSSAHRDHELHGLFAHVHAATGHFWLYLAMALGCWDLRSGSPLSRCAFSVCTTIDIVKV